MACFVKNLYPQKNSVFTKKSAYFYNAKASLSDKGMNIAADFSYETKSRSERVSELCNKPLNSGNMISNVNLISMFTLLHNTKILLSGSSFFAQN